jgi:hypothetical protein
MALVVLSLLSRHRFASERYAVRKCENALNNDPAKKSRKLLY